MYIVVIRSASVEMNVQSSRCFSLAIIVGSLISGVMACMARARRYDSTLKRVKSKDKDIRSAIGVIFYRDIRKDGRCLRYSIIS